MRSGFEYGLKCPTGVQPRKDAEHTKAVIGENEPVGSTKLLKAEGSPWTMRRGHQIQQEKIDWMWENRFGKSVVSIIEGWPDQGKSQIAYNFAATLSRGGSMPRSKVRMKRGATMIFNNEESIAGKILPRLEVSGMDLSKVVFPPKDAWLDLKDEWQRLEEALEKCPDVDLLILDPLQSYFGDGDPNSPKDARQIMGRLPCIAETYDICIVALNHWKRRTGSNAEISDIEMGMGSRAINAAIRAIHKFVKDPATNTGKMVSVKNNNLASVEEFGFSFKAKQASNG